MFFFQLAGWRAYSRSFSVQKDKNNKFSGETFCMQNI
jgi:hypothetical protein